MGKFRDYKSLACFLRNGLFPDWRRECEWNEENQGEDVY